MSVVFTPRAGAALEITLAAGAVSDADRRGRYLVVARLAAGTVAKRGLAAFTES